MALQRVKSNTEGFKIIRSRLDAAVDTALVQTAILIRDEAKALAPRDTEAMAESIYISQKDKSDYEEAVSNARAKFEAAKAEGKTPKGVRLSEKSQINIAPELRPETDKQVLIVVPVDYAAVQEYGGVTQPAQPFLLPSVVNNRGLLTKQMRVALSGIAAKTQLTVYSRKTEDAE